MKFPKRQNNGDGPSNFLKVKDGESVTGILSGKLYIYYQNGFGPTAQIVGPGEGKQRFRHNFVVKEGDQYVAKVWEFGPKIYDQLAALDENGWELEKTLLTISRTGSTKENTKYTVTPSKKEPPAAALKEISKLELNHLEPKVFQSEIDSPPLKNYAPGSDEVPF
jgi:hypothetical protein